MRRFKLGRDVNLRVNCWILGTLVGAKLCSFIGTRAEGTDEFKSHLGNSNDYVDLWEDFITGDLRLHLPESDIHMSHLLKGNGAWCFRGKRFARKEFF